jgi:muconolactone delta-isomerase
VEYLVTMTTQVPADVADEEVAAVRQREAANTRSLARAGRVLRLWRPPLAPGEWRTLGLFDAEGPAALEQTLATMPLRIWRRDEVTPLVAHANDPGRDRVPLDPGLAEFLTTFTLAVPRGTSAVAVEAMAAREAARTAELAAAGRLLRLWTLPEIGHNLGLWQAPDATALRDVLRSLPMIDWLVIDTVVLTRHPNDPATAAPAPDEPASAG